jgi:hypothetical protein
MTDSPLPAEVRRRPAGVIILSGLQFVRAGFLVAQLAGLTLSVELSWLRTAAQLPDPPDGTPAWFLTRGVGIALSAASIVLGFGLFIGRRWAWVGSIVISGLSLALALGAWWDNHPVYVAMAINVVAVFYLNQREVGAFFGEANDAPVDPSGSHVVGV